MFDERLALLLEVQPRYNLAYREAESELFPLCLSEGGARWLTAAARKVANEWQLSPEEARAIGA